VSNIKKCIGRYFCEWKILFGPHHRMITTLMTNAKLEILNARDRFIKSVLANVNQELLKLRNHKSHYLEILKNLILQAMYQVLL